MMLWITGKVNDFSLVSWGVADIKNNRPVGVVCYSNVDPVNGAMEIGHVTLHSWTESLRFQLRESRIHVIEITPPMEQTDLHGSKDSQIAMPLDDFIEEVMVLLQSDSQSKEINVERSKLFRFAERNGKYDEIFLALNSHQ
ncbi:hypothetical protein PSTG_18498 [Puccinia striiformis f. sp. tritici PST-78]|uniref:Uncharacterized protein n=1 Tax=Puccinia striiformis f. sp. tritici PST-78 TaxID=1165861 RepID=A0A0L0UM13_9BASI|nr:hypothetical protein PSTG_18498 [Puccinia striiformis f. sp. tritici PST-78]